MNLVCLFFYLFVFAFYAEILNGHQKWQENDFWQKSPVDSADNLRVKNTQKFKMASKRGRKTIFRKIAGRLCRYPTSQKFCRNHGISLRFQFQDKWVFVFNAEIQDGCQKWRENNFCEKSPVDSADTLRVKNFVEIALSHSIIEINMFWHLRQKFKMAAKSGGKMIFEKSRQ